MAGFDTADDPEAGFGLRGSQFPAQRGCTMLAGMPENLDRKIGMAGSSTALSTLCRRQVEYLVLQYTQKFSDGVNHFGVCKFVENIFQIVAIVVPPIHDLSAST